LYEISYRWRPRQLISGSPIRKHAEPSDWQPSLALLSPNSSSNVRVPLAVGEETSLMLPTASPGMSLQIPRFRLFPKSLSIISFITTSSFVSEAVVYQLWVSSPLLRAKPMRQPAKTRVAAPVLTHAHFRLLLSNSFATKGKYKGFSNVKG